MVHIPTAKKNQMAQTVIVRLNPGHKPFDEPVLLSHNPKENSR